MMNTNTLGKDGINQMEIKGLIIDSGLKEIVSVKKVKIEMERSLLRISQMTLVTVLLVRSGD